MTRSFLSPGGFSVLALAPSGPGRPAIAAAATRAGGIGLIDLAYLADESDRVAAEDVRWLIDHSGTDADLGLRLSPNQWQPFSATRAELRGRAAVIVLTAPATAALAAAVRSEGHALLIEVRNAADIAEAIAVGPDAIVACGHECGGPVGKETTFVLVQRALGAGPMPVIARGGLGLRTAAGCRAAGVRGVVLDDQLLLTSESPLPGSWRQHLVGLTGQETIVVGPPGGRRCRVIDRPACGGTTELKRLERDIEAADAGCVGEWTAAIAARVGWGAPACAAWPVGQGIGVADVYSRRYRSTERVVRAFLQETEALVSLAGTQRPLTEGSPLAVSHATRFPIVQGPMTRVSDVPAFAAAVADAGALPLIALAVLRAEQARPLLESTRDLLGDRPWGVGILGFVPPELKRAQLDEIRRVRPSFALVAGGRPDEAAPLEAEGIPTYLHVPAPSLLRRYLAQGARRFVFEGRECGGHVGPLGSFPLWEGMADVLADWAARVDPSDIHVLFAGGIHDGRSAAVVAAVAAPLAARGIKCGVLMGTAYLFTEEAVATGAITARYQREALACRETVLLVTGVGHANRVAQTPFTHEFGARRRALVRSRRPPTESRDELEQLTLGRLRLASKGRLRNDRGDLIDTTEEQQASGGIYMLGQVAALRATPWRMQDLHDDVARASVPDVDVVRRAPLPPRAARDDDDAVAIIGLSVLVPGARLPERLWRHLLDQANQIREVPRQRWDARRLFDPDKTARDRTYSKWGGFVDPVPFDPVEHRIPPAVLPQICAHQLLALEASRWALKDAGYLDRRFDRESTAVIIGVAETGGLLGNALIVRTMLPFILDDVPAAALDRLPEWTGESFTGMLGNVTAGRIANELDLGGANFCVDAACATSLLAMDLAVREIRDGRASMALAGGVDTLQTPFGFMAFAQTQALSPTGCARVFDESADGIVVSEGVVVAVLKRLSEARRDGDRLYAIVRGGGTSADGRGLGLTAPRPVGQKRAVTRALADAGLTADAIDLYEAHGTGTALGDRTEIETLTSVLVEAGARPRSCAIGSAKSLVGHTKAAAGLVGVVKAALALRHGVLPPHAGVQHPLNALADPSNPLYLLDRPRPWLATPGRPRRAGVNAFGFGGTNAALVLESADEWDPVSPGADLWPAELFVFAGATAEAALASLAAVRQALDAGAEPRVRDLAFSLALALESTAPGPRVAIVAASLDELKGGIVIGERALRGDGSAIDPNVVVGCSSDARDVACLFPGQGSQAPHMALEQTLYFREVREAIELADAQTAAGDTPLSSFIFPPAAFDAAEAGRQRLALAATTQAQPAIGAVSAGLLDLLERLGVRPAAWAGHSFGELTALHAAGAMSRSTLLRLAAERGRAMAAGCEGGGMLAIQASRERVSTLVSQVPGVGLANHNGPTQVVISGTVEGVAAAKAACDAAGIRSTPLSVGGAFHSPLMQGAVGLWREALSRASIRAPQRGVVFGTDGNGPHDHDPEHVRARLADQVVKPVELVAQIEALYEAGSRTFIEVGPGAVLTGLTSAILGSRPHLAVALDPRGGHLRGLLHTLGVLAAAGLQLTLSRLFDGRDVRALRLDRLAETQPAPLPATGWWIDGAGAHRQSDEVTAVGRRPLLTADRPAVQAVPPVSPASVVSPPPLPAPVAAARPETTPLSMMPEPVVPANPQGSEAVLAAYAAYQETMRTFLAVQEQVLTSFLSTTAGPATAASWPVALPPLATQTPAPAPPAMTLPASPIPRPSPQPIVAPAGAREDLQARLLEVFAVQTGYPVEMLGLDMDLAADLGVDSIRQVQALAEFADALPVKQRAAVALLADELTQLRTLRAILECVTRAVSVGADAASPVAGQTPVGWTAGAADRDAIVAAIQQLVSQHTGYPVAMLDPSHDLEGDLGVDSIRRADLLQAFAEHLPAGALASHQLDRILTARTIGEIADLAVAAMTSSRPAGAVTLREPAGGACPSFATEELALPLDRTQARLIRGTAVITADDLGVAPLVAEICGRRGLRPLILPRETLADRDALRRMIGTVRGHVGAVVHLAPLSRAAMPVALADWRVRTEVEAKSLFHVLSVLASDPAAVAGVRLITTSLMGGRYGRDGRVGPGTPAGGAGLGMLRCLLREWPSASAAAVDLPGDFDEARLATAVADELFHGDDHVEVGYDGRSRVVFGTSVTARDTGAADSACVSEPGWVVLATGGARGITAEALVALAGPAVTFVVAGRHGFPAGEPVELASVPDADVRAHVIRQAAAEGERATPASLEGRVRDIVRQREMRHVRRVLERAGAAVVYRACDVRDPVALPELVAWTYATYGRLDAVVHGAGVIEDAHLTKKEWASFDRVFDTKVDGIFQLARAIKPAGLKLLVLFSSVSGRVGNEGQADYAAANEVLNRFAWYLHGLWPVPRVVSIAWGPWASAGMASERVRTKLMERGIEPIEPEAGRRLLASEMSASRTDVEIVAGLGPWDDCGPAPIVHSHQRGQADGADLSRVDGAASSS